MKFSWILVFSALFLPVGVSFAGDCLSSRIPEEAEKCLSGKKENIEKRQRKPTRFPVRFHGFMWDKNEGKKVDVDWFSENGNSLSISTPHVCGVLACASIGKTIKEIPVTRIVSFQQKVAGTGDNSSEQVQSVAIGAFIVPILAPFAAAINSRTHEIYEWNVSYISDQGIEEVETFVTSSTVPVADRYYTFLPTLTGLNNGQRRPDEVLKGLRLEGLKRLEQKILKLESMLITYDPKKPWCASLRTSDFPLVAESYSSAIASANEIRSSLGIASRRTVLQSDQDSLWEKYLDEKPNLKAWADANPATAKRHKKCL